MTTSLAHIARRPVLGAALALALAGALRAGTIEASAQSPTLPTRLAPEQPRAAELADIRSTTSVPAPPSRYGWPVKPFREQHPVRGFFGDPRISNHQQTRQFHFGVDVSAPNGTPVYATLTGRIWISARHPHTVEILGLDGTEFSYWHVIPAVRSGERAVAYRTVIGRIEEPYGHVHFSEARHGRYLNPLRPRAMGPFVDGTTPWVARVTAERGDRTLPSSGVRSAFDLVAERTVKYERRIADREYETSVEIKLSNRKKEAVTIVVEEFMRGDWKMTESSHTFTNKDARTAKAEVPVAAGAVVTVRYSARVTM